MAKCSTIVDFGIQTKSKKLSLEPYLPSYHVANDLLTSPLFRYDSVGVKLVMNQFEFWKVADQFGVHENIVICMFEPLQNNFLFGISN